MIHPDIDSIPHSGARSLASSMEARAVITQINLLRWLQLRQRLRDLEAPVSAVSQFRERKFYVERWTPGAAAHLARPHIRDDAQVLYGSWLVPFLPAPHRATLETIQDRKTNHSYFMWGLRVCFNPAGEILERQETLVVADHYRMFDSSLHKLEVVRTVAQSYELELKLELTPLMLAEVFHTAEQALLFHTTLMEAIDFLKPPPIIPEFSQPTDGSMRK